MRALALHQDVLLVTSALLQANCVIVRGSVVEDGAEQANEVLRVSQHDPAAEVEPVGETFVIDSPVLPDELDALSALVAQARFPMPSGLLGTHGDWDHLLARLAFPDAALGVAESTAAQLAASPGRVQRELRSFDEELMIERPRPLALGAVQALPVPGRCDVGDRELELHEAAGHTGDGMAVMISWAGILVLGDYLSRVELPTLGDGGGVAAYRATLERLRPLVERAEQIVPGHGPVLERAEALVILEQDLSYLGALLEQGAGAELPDRCRTSSQRRLHAQNVVRLASETMGEEGVAVDR